MILTTTASAAPRRAAPEATGAGATGAGTTPGLGRRAGFTLLELLVVMAIMLALMTMAPSIIGGDRDKLESTASTIVSVMTGAREQAIADGHEVRVQFELPGSEKDRANTGRFRYLITSQTRKKSKALTDADAAEGQEVDENADRGAEEWIETEWRSLPEGVVLSAISLEAEHWIKTNPRGDPIEVAFDAEGVVRPPCAFRLVCVDMPTGSARTMTVRVNGLTSLAGVDEGEVELPKSRDPSDFK